MKVGLLCYVGSDELLEEKIRRVAQVYRRKHGTKPTMCYVNPSLLEGLEGPLTVDGMVVEAKSTVLLDHFWIGEETRDDI